MFSEIIGRPAELCQQRGGKTKKKVPLDGDETLSIIEDRGLEYKDYETPEKLGKLANRDSEFELQSVYA